MTTVNYYALAEPPQFERELTKEKTWVTKDHLSFARPKIVAEPETRLWMICTEAAPPRLSVFEWSALLVFGVAATFGLACCVFEWVHLSDTGSLDQVVQAFLTR